MSPIRAFGDSELCLCMYHLCMCKLDVFLRVFRLSVLGPVGGENSIFNFVAAGAPLETRRCGVIVTSRIYGRRCVKAGPGVFLGRRRCVFRSVVLYTIF